MDIKFTEEQRQNLIIFLDRVDLKGSEVMAFVEIMELLHKHPSKGCAKNSE